MGELLCSRLTLRAATLEGENPLPPLSGRTDLHADAAPGEDTPRELWDGLAYGRVGSVLPYMTQDRYTRELTPIDVPVAVLQNDRLRATFLLGAHGGRLWSLRDRPSGRELLHSPRILRLANLALRNAWFAGGVEWNIGTTGHSPTTCEPLHAARVETPAGENVLRMYDYERMRGVVFQIDAWLPDRSPALFVAVSVRNTTDHEVPMYWWSNAAVPEGADVRVVAPAQEAYFYGYERALHLVPVPLRDGTDVSYTAQARDAADYFFRLPASQRPWIAALDGSGNGLVQTSSARLRGRKLFCWGTGTGGRHWQDWLGEPGSPYLEIQAGLAATQLEHVRMPAAATWSWVEAYGPLSADPARVHGGWTEARAAVEQALETIVPARRVEAELRAAASWRDCPPAEVVAKGTGWGALEELRRAAAGERPVEAPGTPFGQETLSQAQRTWVSLLRSGALPLDGEPAAPIGGGGWRRLLLAAPSSWHSELQLALIAHAADDSLSAHAHVERSLAERRTPWGLRMLAVLRQAAGRSADAADLYWEAYQAAPGLRPLAIEAGNALLAAGRADRALEVVASLPDVDQVHGRVRLLEAMAAVAAGQQRRARGILEAGLVIDDLREGEGSLEELWRATHPGRTLPDAYNFRMRGA